MPKNTKKMIIGLFVLSISILSFTTFFKSSAQDKYKLPIDTSYVDDLEIKVKRSAFGESKIYNAKKFYDLSDINSYIRVRKQALTLLAKELPNQEIEVAISPSEKFSLSSFKEAERNLNFRTQELSLDLFIADKWDRMVWIKNYSQRIDINQNADSLIKNITEVENLSLENRKTNNGKLERGEFDGMNKISFSGFDVRFARIMIKTSDALKLSEMPNILLVDPISDIASHFEGKVIDMPHLYVVKELKFGNSYALENTTAISSK